MNGIHTKRLSAFLAAAIIFSCVFSSFTAYAVDILPGYSDIYPRVGLYYGQSTVDSYKFSSNDGFRAGIIANGRDFTEKFSISSPNITVCVQSAYHLELARIFETVAALNTAIGEYENLLYDNSLEYFIALDSDGYKLRFGNFSSLDDINATLDAIGNAMPTLLVVPQSDRICVKDTKKGAILFECEDFVFGITAKNENLHTTLENGSIYGGVFEITRSAYGLTIINIVELEEYVTGVVPYEIYSSWSLEMLKTFAIIARTYVLFNLGKHSSYNFDVCATTACQVYGGYGRVTDSVKRAVKETEGLVLTYKNRLAETLYSSSHGGSSVSALQAFGGPSYDYLVGNIFDWEPYETFPNGKWSATVSAIELCEYLKGKGYDLSGYIKDVSIERLADDSTYVYILKITDGNGKSVTLKTTEKVRTALSKYVKSANFTVTKTVNMPDFIEEIPAGAVMTANGKEYISQGDSLYAVGDGEKNTVKDSANIYVITDKGTDTFSLDYEYEFLQAIRDTNAAMRNTAEMTAVFTFDGKGYGHGVGLSQYGANYLATIGKTTFEILATYYPGTKIMSVG